MSTTLHLFRHDVRRLRWWLVAWAAFLVGTHWWWHMTVWAERRVNHDQWLRNFFDANTVAVVVWLALQVTLAALLLLPHGPDDPRLFWRTRPIAPRDMVRAKFLFSGVFLIALPLLVETGFWLAWLRVGETAALWPGMLLKLAALSAFLLAVITLAGREGKRYGFCVLGVLVVFGGWMQVGAQLAMRAATGTEFESWPAMESPHLLGQVWEFWTRNQAGRTVSMSSRTAVVPVYVLAVAGWVVVACRYLFPVWRAARLALETAVLVALGAAFVRGERAFDDNHPKGVVHTQRLKSALEGTQVRLNSVRLEPTVPWWRTALHGTHPLASPAAFFEWQVEGAPPGTVLLVRLNAFSTGTGTPGLTNVAGRSEGIDLFNREVGYFASAESNQLANALPELAGHRLHVARLASWHEVKLPDQIVAMLTNRPTTLAAKVSVGVVKPEVMAVLPLRAWTSVRVGTAKVRVEGAPAFNLDIKEPSDPMHRFLWDPTLEVQAPNLFLLRNPRTKEVVALNWNSMPSPEVRVEFSGANVCLPYSSHHMSFARRICFLEKAVARHGFDAAWLAEAELLCVRLKLVGHARRSVPLENFRLEPAER